MQQQHSVLWIQVWCRSLELTEKVEFVEGGSSYQSRPSLFGILSRLTQMTALMLDVALKGEVEGPLELPLLQTLNVYHTEGSWPVREYASLQSTTMTSLTLWVFRQEIEFSYPHSVSNPLLPQQGHIFVDW